ncbi:caspase 4, apoptosis-related cysteine peptidase, partial [Chelydra serpentina]
KRLLEGLGYKVETHCNLNAQAMAETLKQFAARNEHRTSDSTFLVLMSHGVRTGLCGTKSQGESTDVLSVDTIYTTFNNKNCQALVGKPKVIIIQACRGENRGQVLVSDSAELPGDGSSLALLSPEGLEDDASHLIHVESDFIGFQATTPGNCCQERARGGGAVLGHAQRPLALHRLSPFIQPNPDLLSLLCSHHGLQWPPPGQPLGPLCQPRPPSHSLGTVTLSSPAPLNTSPFGGAAPCHSRGVPRDPALGSSLG